LSLKQKINMKQLRCFHAVAQEGGFTAAARALFVGQPNVTSHVRSLEQQFGVELFNRGSQSIELNPVGHSLFEVTQRIFDLEIEAAQTLKAAANFKLGRLRIGSITAQHATHLTLAFGQRYPDIELSVSIGNSHDVLAGLFELRSDVAIVTDLDNNDRLHAIPLGEDRVVLLVGIAHPWADRQYVLIEELEQQRVILREQGSATRKVIEDALSKAEVNVHSVLEIGSKEALREAVAAGIGIGIALEREQFADNRLRTVSVSNANLSLNPFVACLRERREAPLIAAFMSVVEAQIADVENAAKA
jgi:aminoethylphosphonate catabolism LysR family transcriptional regulator